MYFATRIKRNRTIEEISRLGKNSHRKVNRVKKMGNYIFLVINSLIFLNLSDYLNKTYSTFPLLWVLFVVIVGFFVLPDISSIKSWAFFCVIPAKKGHPENLGSVTALEESLPALPETLSSSLIALLEIVESLYGHYFWGPDPDGVPLSSD